MKRTLDLVIATLLLLAALPLLAVVCILIRFESRGPALFRQTRMGRNFVSFQILKLRTMRMGTQGPDYTLGPDPRITPLGRWLRHLKLDELPQLWNVVCGDMSLVGPRPVLPQLAVEFRSAYNRLLEVRPGLTDPATLKYCHEAEILAASKDPLHTFKSVVTPDKLRISQAYIARATVWTDLGVLLQTMLALIPRRGSGRSGAATGTVLNFPQPAGVAEDATPDTVTLASAMGRLIPMDLLAVAHLSPEQDEMSEAPRAQVISVDSKANRPHGDRFQL